MENEKGRDRVDEVLRMLGGPQGFFAILFALGAVAWRIKMPQIGLDYLMRELEIHRKELAESDHERAELRDAVRLEKDRLLGLEADYMRCLTDREKCRQHIRLLERQLRQLGHDPVEGEEERS